MKLLLLISFMLFSTMCQTQNIKSDVTIVEVKNEEIPKLIFEIFKENKNVYNWNKTVFIVYFKTILGSQSYEMRISILSESELNWLLNYKQKNAFGYFEHKNIRVLVFGEANALFTKSINFKNLDWLKQLPKKSNNHIELPPLNLEPTVRSYSLNGSEIELKYIGNYPIFN